MPPYTAYGQACGTCSRAKVKCTPSSDGGRCERCHHLNRECRPSLTVRRRNPRKRAASKATQLEGKLDNILSLLQPGPPSANVYLRATDIRDFQPQGSNGLSTTVSPGGSVGLNNSASGAAVMLSPPNNGFDGDHGSLSAFGGVVLTADEAEVYLLTFRNLKSKYFPFVYIPDTTTARQLCHDRPFLYTCIMAISSNSTAQQQALSVEIKEVIAQKMLHEPSDGNLDLLLGLLAYISWSISQVSEKPRLSVLTQLANSLVYELGLNKPPPTNMPPCDDDLASSPPIVRTMEERRAVLGCFLTTSIIASYLRKIDALRWTPHLEECRQVLDEGRECLNDEILAQQARLQLIAGNAALGNRVEAAVRVPPTFYLPALLSQMQDVKTSLRPHLQVNEVILAHIHSTTLAINELALTDTPILSITDPSDFQRLNSLHACLDAIKSWFNVFFSISPAAYTHLPFSIISQLMHCLGTLYRLSTLDDPAWDTANVRKSVDVLLILDQVIDQAMSLAVSDGDVFSRRAQTLSSMKARWEAKLRSNVVLPAVSASAEETLNAGFPVDLSGDDWISDILMNWNA
ncbi:hypothetical protein BJX70DRAFT_381181 [Aspergillus crustosus]